MITRRMFLSAAPLVALGGCTTPFLPTDNNPNLQSGAAPKTMPAFYGPIPEEPFPIPAVPRDVVPQKFWRTRVENPFPGYSPGTIVIDPNAFYLHLIEENGTAMRYGIGVGRQGFAWSGDAIVQYKREWPRWKAPDSMVARQPDLEPYSVANGGMDPGIRNPLGARALYLFQNGEDTLYRIHGNPEADSIGRAVSSGCVRLLNHDIIDLHNRVPNKSRVVVRPSTLPGQLA